MKSEWNTAEKLLDAADGTKSVFGFEPEIPLGKITVLVGRSDCGKTTLLNLLGGLDRPDGGSNSCAAFPWFRCCAGG